MTLLLHSPRIWTCRACCLRSRPHCLLLQPALLSLPGQRQRCCGLQLSADRCIVDRPLIYFMVGGNGYSRLPKNLNVFIPGNTGMKKSGNPGRPGNWSPGMNSLIINDWVLKAMSWPWGTSRPICMALASKIQAWALKAALTSFCYTCTFKCNKYNNINNNYNNRLIVIYV